MENQHQRITGYRDFDEDTIHTINTIKGVERSVASLWRNIQENTEADKRELALAKTHFEDAFMHFVKAVAKPESAW